MSTHSWQHAFAIFEQAAQMSTAERQAFLDRSCGDGEVRRAVEDLLKADDLTATFFDSPWVERPWAAEDGPDGTEPQPRATPSMIGPYRLLRRVGQGGMSTVYLAVRADDSFRRRVVVKLVRRGMESEIILRRLRTERQILAHLEHPYIARLYDGGSTQEGLPYFVMEYIDGLPIDTYCEQNRLTVARRLALFRKVCAAVQFAHQNLVVHRDIKPSNILVTADGNPKLLDFGIAKLLSTEFVSEEVEPTATWQRAMTPSYASPEQIRGRQITTASDIYSLGVLLYKLLTGRLPHSFSGLLPREIERLISETDPVRPSDAVEPPPESDSDKTPAASEAKQDTDQVRSVRKMLRGDLDSIVLKALRSVPLERYSSVERFAEDVERYQQGLPVTARAGSWRYRAGKFVRRHRAAAALVAALAVLLVGFATAMVWQSARVARERDQARLERDKKEEVLKLLLDVFELSNPYVLPGETLTAREALTRSVPVLEAGLKEQPEVRAELLYTSGSILTVLGDYNSAERQLGEALRIRRELRGESHVDVVKNLSALAAVQKELGDLDQAEALALRSVELARRQYAEAHPDLVDALNEWVSVLCYRSDYETAESPARDALDLARDLPRGVDQEILALEYLALIRSTQGDYPKATELYREALARRRSHSGENHPIQINTLSNLALNLRRQEELEAAERTYLELVELQRENYGEDYSDPVTLASLASLRFAQNDFSGSRELFEEAIDSVIDTRGETHWMVFVFEVGIERSRLREGAAPSEVESRLREGVERWLPTFGEDHWRMAEARSILGESISVQGRCKEAEPLLVASYRQLLAGARHRQRETALDRLRDHLVRCGQAQEIERYEAMATDGTTG